MRFFGFCFVLLWVVFARGQYENCAYKLSVLEEALYGIKNNQKGLNFGFFPSRQRSSRYLEVIYEFLKEDSDDVDCVVTYYWSVGSFLFVQPPSVFQFTSLYFNFPDNEIDNITLQLPSECRPIVFSNVTEQCSCRDPGDTILDVLSRHLLEYARYNVPGQVIRDERSTARAICSDEIKEAYYDTHEVKAFFALILLSPFLWAVWVFLFYCGNKENVGTTLKDKNNKPYIAALACTSIVVMIYIIIMDFLAALYFACGWHEYELHGILDTFNHIITWLSFFLNCAVCIISLELFCFEHYTNKINDYSKFIYIIGGATICFSSHLGYIIIAWLTEPGKTASIFLTALCVLFFLVAVFRSAHTITSLQCYGCLAGSDNPYCNCFFIVLVGFIFGVIPSIFILGVFNVIPVPAYELANYFENIIRIILVLAAGIFTYRVLSFEDSDIKKFLKHFTTPLTKEEADENYFVTTGKQLGKIAKMSESILYDGLIPNTQCGASMLLEGIIFYLNKEIDHGSDLSGRQRKTPSSITFTEKMDIISFCKRLRDLYQMCNKTNKDLNSIHTYEQTLLNLLEKHEDNNTQWKILKDRLIIYIIQCGQKIDDKKDADFHQEPIHRSCSV